MLKSNRLDLALNEVFVNQEDLLEFLLVREAAYDMIKREEVNKIVAHKARHGIFTNHINAQLVNRKFLTVKYTVYAADDIVIDVDYLTDDHRKEKEMVVKLILARDLGRELETLPIPYALRTSHELDAAFDEKFEGFSDYLVLE